LVEEKGTLRTIGNGSNALQTSRGQLSFIADYFEDPAVTELSDAVSVGFAVGWLGG